MQEKIEMHQYNQKNQKSTVTDRNQHYTYSTPTQKTLHQLGKQISGERVSTESDINDYYHLQGNIDKNMTDHHCSGLEIQDAYDHTNDQKFNVADDTYDHLEADDKKFERQQYNHNDQKSTATDKTQHYSYSAATQKTLNQLGKQRSGERVSTELDTNDYHHLHHVQVNKIDKDMTSNYYQGLEIQDTYDHTTNQKFNVAGVTYDQLEADDKKSDSKNDTETITYEEISVPVSKTLKADT